MPLMLELALGADTRFDLPVLVDGAVPAGGLAGWSFTFRLLRAEADPDEAALLTLDGDNGAIAIFDSAAGVARLRIARDQLAMIGPGRYWFRLSSLDPAGNHDEPARGIVTFVR